MFTLLLFGCAARQPGVVIRSSAGTHARCAPVVANLALGPSAEHGRVAALFAYRTSWPTVAIGYRFDQISQYTELIYDDQTFYDWHGGGYYRESETIHSGVLLH
ncbi:MAG: hypothetical protein KKB50_12290 [Planctomycetes bacterium]|nr:hypothetical protein [Planctomycetota bacterium]